MLKMQNERGLVNTGSFLFTPTPAYNNCYKLVWGFIILIVLLLSTNHGLGFDAQRLNEDGIKYLKQGRYKDAAVSFERALDLDPKNKTIKHNLAGAYHYVSDEFAKKEQWIDAINYEKKAYAQEPTNLSLIKQIAILYNNYAISLFKKGRHDLAISNFKEALKVAPETPAVRENIYNTTLQEAQNSFEKRRTFEALNLAKECIEFDPKRVDAYMFLGNLYYKKNKLKKALKYWNKAQEIKPTDTRLKDTILKVKKEIEVEGDFKTRARTFFEVRFEGERDSELVWDIIDMLEDARRKVRNDFGFYTDKKVTVIIYNVEQFNKALSTEAELTKRLSWTYGRYDGKIRLKIGDILSDPQFTKLVAFHEYAHAILHIKYPKNMPNWLHEGFAQFAEPEREISPHEKNILRNVLKTERVLTLDKMNNYFKSNSQDTLSAGYLTSKLFVKYLVRRYGKIKFKSLLKKLHSGKDLKSTMYELYRIKIDNIDKKFITEFLY